MNPGSLGFAVEALPTAIPQDPEFVKLTAIGPLADNRLLGLLPAELG